MIRTLNPFTTLFARIFIWFWLATGLTVFAVMVIVSRVAEPVEVLPLTASQQKLAIRIESTLARVSEAGLSKRKVMKRLGRMNSWLVVLVDPNTKNVKLGFPRPIAGRLDIFSEYSSSDKLIRLRNKNADFIGPFDLITTDETNIVFVGRLLPKTERPSRTPLFIYGGVIALIMGSIFCGVLVWNITRPIKQISQASRDFAKGNLGARVNGHEHRRDEIGLLGKDFNEMAKQIEDQIDNQRMLMANVSHELRTPLTRMQLAVALIEGDKQHSESMLKNTTRLTTDIKKMDEMIEQILKISKAQSKQCQHQFNKADLSVLLNDLIDEAEIEAKTKEINIDTNVDANVIYSFDSESLKSAFENVLRNALKYAEQQVSLSLIADSANNQLVIEVDDDGKGVDTTDREKLFEPFYRVSNPNTPSKNGTGLGLAIAKASIEAHNGSIIANKSELGGLNITIRLPIRDCS